MNARLTATALALVWSGVIVAGCTERPTEPLATAKPLADVGPLGVVIPMANAGPDTSTYVNVPVQLGGTATDELGRPILSWEWKVVWGPEGPGGGTLSAPTSDTTDFTGDSVGAYYVQLTACVQGAAGVGVMNNVTLLCSAPDEVQVIVVNRQPIAKVTADKTTVTVGETVVFDGSGSSDPDQQALTYSWNFDDGWISNVVSPTHAFAAPGEYRVSLEVSDGWLTSKDTILITVEKEPSPQDGIQTLISGIQSLVSNGELSADRGDGMLTKLNDAITSLDNDQPRDACKQLSAFAKQVTASIKARKLDAQIGQELIQATTSIRTLIGCA